jgi:AraC-like DNA-binding protein/predicted GNAT family acetyltransferase
MPGNVKNVIGVIDYIESHLHEKPDLDTITKALHYSKYYLHRMFTNTVGLTIQTYAQRRRLTEAAKLLVFSDKPILEIALIAGYESQQSFTDSFRAMYKKAPNQYREAEEFYPLQLRYVLNENPANLEGEASLRQTIDYATEADIPEWMELVHLVIDGFPHLDEGQYLEQLRECIRNRRALILKDGDTAVGIMAFNEMTGSIDFLGVHPQYRKKGIAKAFCEKALHELACSEAITITTFREGDKADNGYRKTIKSLGFAEAERLVEFGYPTQKFILQKSKSGFCSQVLWKEETEGLEHA